VIFIIYVYVTAEILDFFFFFDDIAALGQVNTISYKGYRLEVSRYKSSDTGSNYDDMFNRFLPQTEYISVR
jgi:hypothetical protein